MNGEKQKLRHEIKYYINRQVYHVLSQRLAQVIEPDPNMLDPKGYLISSLYFDDMYHSAFYEKNAGTSFRKKYRIRTYGRNPDKINLECKMKYNDLIGKTSAKLNRMEYEQLLSCDFDPMFERKEEVCKQILGYNRSRRMRPNVVVEYLREAYIYGPGNVRITFDKEISASVGTLDMFSEEFSTKRIHEQDIMVMEVKYDEFLPAHVGSIIQTGMTDLCAISKYVMCREEKGRLMYR